MASASQQERARAFHRLHEGVPQDEEDGLFDPFEAAAPTSKLGQDLLRLRDWADAVPAG